MRKAVLCVAVWALVAQAAYAAPSLGFWEEGAPGSTHQFWGFSSAEYVKQIVGDGYHVLPEQVSNPDPESLLMLINSPPAVWNSANGTMESMPGFGFLVLDIKIPNYPRPTGFKEIWVDLGLLEGSFLSVSYGAGGGGPFTYQTLTAQGDAEFGIKIVPNPEWENVVITLLADPTSGRVVLDYIHLDTICIPAPSALLLGSVGAGLLGWLRRRRSL